MNKLQPLNTVTTIEQKECRVTLSPAAQNAISDQTNPLVAEVVVTLACCIRKTLNFREALKDEAIFRDATVGYCAHFSRAQGTRSRYLPILAADQELERDRATLACD